MNGQDPSKLPAGLAAVNGGKKALVGLEHMGEIAAVFESSVELTCGVSNKALIRDSDIVGKQGDASQARSPTRRRVRKKNGDANSAAGGGTEAERVERGFLTGYSTVSEYRVNDNNNAVTRTQSDSSYLENVDFSSVVEEKNVRRKTPGSTTLAMASSSTHAMDLFTSTPRSLLPQSATHNNNKFVPEVCDVGRIGGGAGEGFESDDRKLRAREAEFTANLQSRSCDSSVYATYMDLSALGSVLGDVDDVTYFDENEDDDENSERLENGGDELCLNGSIGSRESSSDRESRAGLDLRPSDSRHLNKSIESILSEISRDKASESSGESTDDLPLDRTRSLDNIRLHSDCVCPSTTTRKKDNLSKKQSNNSPARVEDKETNPDRLTDVLLTARGDSNVRESRVCNLKGDRVIARENANADATHRNPESFPHTAQHTQRSPNIHVNSSNYYEDVKCTRSGAATEDAVKSTDSECTDVSLSTDTHKNTISEKTQQSPCRLRGEQKQDEVITEKGRGESYITMEKVAGDGAASSDMAEVESLRKQIRAWEEKYGELEKRVRGMEDSGSTMESYTIVGGDIEKLSLPELHARLMAAETLIVDLRDHLECYKDEIEEMQLELDEAADKVREGDIEEYRDLKHELDQVTKEWRILQYRLRKADRRIEQMEHERLEWEEKCQILMIQMDEMQKEMLMQKGGDVGGAGGGGAGAGPSAGGSGIASDKGSSAGGSGSDEEEKTVDKEILGLKQELKIAKDVSIRLHQELEMVEEKRARTEEENQLMRKRFVESEASRKELKRDLEKTRLEVRSPITPITPH